MYVNIYIYIYMCIPFVYMYAYLGTCIHIHMYMYFHIDRTYWDLFSNLQGKRQMKPPESAPSLQPFGPDAHAKFSRHQLANESPKGPKYQRFLYEEPSLWFWYILHI